MESPGRADVAHAHAKPWSPETEPSSATCRAKSMASVPASASTECTVYVRIVSGGNSSFTYASVFGDSANGAMSPTENTRRCIVGETRSEAVTVNVETLRAMKGDPSLTSRGGVGRGGRGR